MDIEIGKIGDYQSYIDRAFKKGKSKVTYSKIKDRRLTKDEKYKHLESIRISVIKDVLSSDLDKIIEKMPDYNNLEPLYKELFKCFTDLDKYKKAHASIRWAVQRITSIFRSSTRNIARLKTVKEVISERNIFLARCSSFMKQISPSLEFLDEARKKIREIPNIKTGLNTAAIAGFPNVGKTTLLSKITSSQPEINSYAFTTKGLMIGYIRTPEQKIQIIDTPGTLNRFEKMNNIEKMAHISMDKIANIIVYIFDLTEPYPIEDQIKLYNNLKQLNKKIIVYFSKSDIIGEKTLIEFAKEHKIDGIYDSEKLKKDILSTFTQP